MNSPPGPPPPAPPPPGGGPGHPGPPGQPGQPGQPPHSGQRPATAAEPEAKRSVSVGQILGGILFVLVVIFIFENTHDVQVRLIIPQYKMPVALPIVIAAVLGALIAWLLRYRRQRNHPSRNSKRSRRKGSVS
jgi:uncharacterized integral membrane protein